MSDKTTEEVLTFITEQYDAAIRDCRYEESAAFLTVLDYLKSHRAELTPDEISQMKEKVTNTPVTRREVDEEEINGE